MTFVKLAAVEVRRLLARRLFLFLTVLVVAGSAFTGVMVFIASDDSSEARARAEAAYVSELQSCLHAATTGEDFETLPPGVTPEAFCNDAVEQGDPRFAFREMEWVIGSLAFLLMVGGWLLGASAVGAEWPSRALTGTLLWEPRRGRVLAAKVLAGSGVAFAWSLLLLAFFSGALYLAATFEGNTSGLTFEWWSGYILLGVRSSVIALLAFAFASALAMIGKSTAAALGVAFAQLAVIEGLIRALKPGWAAWLIGDNTSKFLLGDEMVGLHRSQAGALLLLIVYLAVALAAAKLMFDRREIA